MLILSGCAQQNDVVVENIEFSTSFIENGESQFDISWWLSFKNEELTQLVAQGLQENLSLKARDLRLKSSAINANIASVDLYPSLNLNTSTSSTFDNLGDVNSASLGLSSSWELDLWGSISANENRAYWNHQGQIALYRGRANLVAGSIANAWLGLVSEQEKKRVLAEQFQRTEDALKVISRRFAMGKKLYNEYLATAKTTQVY
jgi:outer membrane protein TolC